MASSPSAGTRLAVRRSAATWAGTCPAAAYPIDPRRPSWPRRATPTTAATIPTSGACPTTRHERGRCPTSRRQSTARSYWCCSTRSTRCTGDFIDGRLFPEDPNPAWDGYSVGRWEGDTLVVETRGFRDDLWIDTWGSPMSSAATMIERISRPTFGRLEIELTIDDPKNYTRPFTVKLAQNFAPDTELIDEFCLENEKWYERMIRSRGK